MSADPSAPAAGPGPGPAAEPAAQRRGGPLDRRLLAHARSSRPGIAGLVLLGAVQAALTVALAWGLAQAVAGLAGAAGTGGTGGTGAAVFVAAAFVLRAALTWAEQALAQRTAARAGDELRRKVLTAALGRGPAWIASAGAGRLAALLTGGLDGLRPWFSGYLPALVLAAVLPPCVLVVLALTDAPSAVAVALTLPFVPVFAVLIGLATRARSEERWQAGAVLAGHFLDVVRGLPTLRLFGRAERQVAAVARTTERHRDATLRVLRLAFLSSTALDLVATLSVGIVAVQAGLRVAAGSLDLAPALFAILLAPEAYRPLREVGARFHAGADASAVVADVDAVLRGEAPARRRARSAGTPAVEARDLRVRHPGAPADALRLAGLRVRGGELVALHGASGAGKTTALRVLAGVQPLTAGEALVAGPEPLHLPQHPALTHARTVAGALSLDGETSLPREELLAALARVGLDAEVSALPGGLDAPLGERGRGLSAGQRQRLALARLLRAAAGEPRVLLLDEPTAHLDPDAEEVVVAQLRAAADRGCAVLVVAHRPALLAAADRHVRIGAPPPPGAAVQTAEPLPPPDVRPQAPRAAGEPAGLPGARTLSRLTARPGSVVLLGASSWLAALTLTAAAAWLLARAAAMPPVLTLSAAVVTVRAAAVARPLLRYAERLAGHEAAFSRLAAWRSQVYADLVPRIPSAVSRRRGELLTRVVADVDARVDGLLRGSLPAAAAAVPVLAALAAGAVLLPAAVPAACAGALLAAVVAPVLAARQARREDSLCAAARARTAEAVLETLDGAEELAHAGDLALVVPERAGRALARAEARAATTAGLAAAVAVAGHGLWVAGTAVAAAQAVDAGRLTVEVAAALVLGLVALAEPLLVLPEAAVARRRATGARARLTELAAAAPAASEPTDPVAPPAGPGLRLRGLVAGWDPQRPALAGADLDLPPGGRIAVTGTSGSGKSTLAAVLVRFLDPVGGSATLGGQEITSLRGDDVRRRITWVGDDTGHVFASTVRENLRLARPGASDADLVEVLRRVRLGSWLTRLPHGLDTWLGEDGSTVSGGERRRLLVARALLADPAVLVLDEPTEGLDEPTARALVADLLEAGAGRSVLLLTHRREGLDLVDRVLRLRDGRLVPAEAAHDRDHLQDHPWNLATAGRR
ncbi:ATP-binding cassette subfamily C protein CydCD [Kineococcus xinjiangensis]|uniref:ATP-binding cassette subfamily C protein CydCD n=1 Tax=Kineococcus xinjiangensis TaxID=512762 RepID=A0A2S6IT13_9ACTN|nr:thiol reductant ABC exporter subunit CydD [Kineococcus xinjiangensis]PPK97392.1 ATP-binding cassette subfamily C protein CydCD [Kineococcus xinjiangensis]